MGWVNQTGLTTKASDGQADNKGRPGQMHRVQKKKVIRQG